jgi:pimeloyl-ACP methyl ester carboxylesterase
VICLRHTPGSGVAAAEADIFNMLKSAMEDPMGKFSKFKLKGRPVAFVGHSEGGRGAIQAAQRIASGELSQFVTKIKALVGFAPTVLTSKKGFTDALLILQGSHDGDSPAGGECMRIFETADVLSKYFLWIHGANHSRFLQPNFVEQDFAISGETDADKIQRIDQLTQVFIAKNYVTMFLLLQLAGAEQFRPVFTGDADVAWVPPPDAGVISNDIKSKRFRALPLYGRTTVVPVATSFIAEQMFQDNLVPISEIHPLKVDVLRDLHVTLLVHHVKGSVVQWNRNLKTAVSPKFTVICDKTLMALLPKFIEFQAILTARSSQNPGPPPQPAAIVAVTLKSGNTKSLPVTVVIERSIDLDFITNNSALNASRSILSTIRIPISKFGSLPAGFLASSDLVLDFTVAPSKTGQVALANFGISWV